MYTLMKSMMHRPANISASVRIPVTASSAVLLRRRSRVQPVMRRRNNMEMDNRTPVVEGKHIDGGQP